MQLTRDQINALADEVRRKLDESNKKKIIPTDVKKAIAKANKLRKQAERAHQDLETRANKIGAVVDGYWVDNRVHFTVGVSIDEIRNQLTILTINPKDVDVEELINKLVDKFK